MQQIFSFTSDVSGISLPKKLNYPFNYKPHKIAVIAAKELQEFLNKQTEIPFNFKTNNTSDISVFGKMFGVLVVKRADNKVGYIAAFSGKLGDKTIFKNFVPPVFNVLDTNGFYKKNEEDINLINSELSSLETNISFLRLKKIYKKAIKESQNLFEKEQEIVKKRRKLRKRNAKTDNQLNINEEFFLREYKVYLDSKILPLQNQFETYQQKINDLKLKRKEKSAKIQQNIFENYRFLNSKNEERDLLDIFEDSNRNIPAGAGECCAPKLLQFSFLNNLIPIAMAEFWWGNPLNTSVRKHGNFYPACTGKCKPILTHMLEGLEVDDNPLFILSEQDKQITILYEDDDMLVIDKPSGLLSVPGKEIEDSVFTRMKKRYPKATGPLLVHRLDMATSGILLIAKTKEIHKALQAQFLDKTIKKRYVAILNGETSLKNGIIELPIRVNLDDRPKQMVCFEDGKQSLTHWKHIETIEGQTKIYLYPITGRTHQLRIHAAHHLGLNLPIVGDELYGIRKDRLYLHAERIIFKHPTTFKEIIITSKVPF